MRECHKFAFFTGTNRREDIPIIASLIRSARAVDVPEDIYVFSPFPVDGGIHFQIPEWTDWRSHMAKLDFLRRLKDTSYDYVIWLDSDSYFVRDPGDFSSLIRSNKCFVSMEGEITGPQIRPGDWWSMRFPTQIVEVMRSHCGSQRLWNTNGGFWIVRVDAITEFADKCDQVFAAMKSQFKDMTDEPPLACAAMSMIPDPELNTTLLHTDKWAADWGGRIYKGRIPDGKPWIYEEWLTGIQYTINPAIVHAMGSKEQLRTGLGYKRPEPVGTKLHELLVGLGIRRPDCNNCKVWMDKMDLWGITGCKQNRTEILHRLAEASDTASWIDMAKVAAAGYYSCGALLDEAIKRSAA